MQNCDCHITVALHWAPDRQIWVNYCGRAWARQHAILIDRAKNQKTRSLRSRVLSGTIKTTITRTSHGFHIIRHPTHAVTVRKEISIKFSSMEKSVSEFIWAANKQTLTLIVFEPRLVIALLLILSWWQSISLHPHCTVILDFCLLKTRIVVHIKGYAVSSVFKTWKKDKANVTKPSFRST